MKQPSPFLCIQSGSDDVDTQDAMTDIIKDAQQQLLSAQYDTPKGAMVFFDPEHDASVIINSLYSQWANLQIAGCSSYGEFNLTDGMQDGSIQVMFFCGDIHLHVRSFVDISPDNLEQHSQKLLDIPHSPAVSFLLFDVVQFRHFESILPILKQQVPDDHVIIGGGASDDFDYNNVTLISNHTVMKSGCVMLHLCGDLRVSTAIALGWKSHGDKSTVTQSSGNTLIEIDHQPALNFYHDKTGGISPDEELPLAVFNPNDEFVFNRANAGEITLPNNSKGLQLYGYIPEGYKVQVSSTSKDTLLHEIPENLQTAQANFPQNRPISLALFFSCVSRRAFLSTKVAKEPEAIMASLPNNVPGMGFYTYGEVGRLTPKCDMEYHNNSLVYVLIG